jgi:hypothetical protein
MPGAGRVMAALVCALALLAAALTAFAATPGSDPGRTLLVGVDDDTAKWHTHPDHVIASYRDLGFDAVRLTIPWQLGQNRPTTEAGIYLHRAAQLVARGRRVVLAVYGRPWQAPVDEAQQDNYCDFIHHVVSRIPIRDIVVWNEANSPQFWPTSAGAPAYEALLAACWDRLRSMPTPINLISTTAVHYDPAGFMRAVGAAYRESGRTRPLVRTFGHNPYPDNSAEPPWTRHLDDPSTVGEGDLPRLLAAIDDAFAGTGQPLPGTRGTTVWYLENGFQTSVPPGKRHRYTGEETDPRVVVPVAPPGSSVRDQATQLRDALLLASCQPEVGAYFNFELVDEERLSGWQSGVIWRDGTRKPSYQSLRQTIALVKAGGIDCSDVPGAGGPIPQVPPSAGAGQRG